MILCMEDRREDLERMRERGFRCLEAAMALGDEKGVMQWQRSVSTIETLLIRGEAIPAPH